MTTPPESPIRVLLVEDSPSDADLVVEALDDPAARAFAVAHVDRLAAALARVAGGAVDVVLLDLSLPDSRGLATFRRLHTAAPAVPIVVLSGLADEEVAAQAVREGAQDYLPKGELDRRLLARTLRYAVERRRAEAAEATLRDRDQFLAVAAHELKTPLTSLCVAAQLLRRGAADRPLDARRAAEALGRIDREAARLALLVDQILATALLQDGRLVLERAPTDLTALVGHVVARARARAREHTVVFEPPGPLRAEVDAVRLEQVVAQLLDNALKFSPAGGHVHVELAESADGTARLAVRDHGLGVPEETRTRLFERFHQAHSADYRSGLGVGLYVCREILRLHGGTIRAEHPPDGGTRMVVVLPTAAATVQDERIS